MKKMGNWIKINYKQEWSGIKIHQICFTDQIYNIFKIHLLIIFNRHRYMKFNIRFMHKSFPDRWIDIQRFFKKFIGVLAKFQDACVGAC